MNTTLNDTLSVLAQSVESLVPAGSQPAWAEITGTLEQPDALRWHPDLETMVGFVAPSDCVAIAAVGYGWGTGLANTGGIGASAGDSTTAAPPAPLRPGQRCRVRMVCLMTRTGDVAGLVRAGSTLLVNEAPSSGRILDFMRRCLGLPTPPPEMSTDTLLAHMWLLSVIQAGRQALTPLGWAEVARLHPALQSLAQAGETIPLADLTTALRVAADVWSWTYLLEETDWPAWLDDQVPASAAGWMDEGVLSRWLLSSITGVDTLLDRAKPLLTPGAAKSLRRVLLRLEVLPVRRPWVQPAAS